MPTKEKLAESNENNVEITENHCEEAELVGYCKPDKSFVDFKCIDGYELDDGNISLLKLEP